MLGTYDHTMVNISVQGIALTHFNGDVVISKEGDDWDVTEGSNGCVQRSKMVRKLYTVTLPFMQTSPQLSKLEQALHSHPSLHADQPPALQAGSAARRRRDDESRAISLRLHRPERRICSSRTVLDSIHGRRHQGTLRRDANRNAPRQGGSRI